MASVASKNLFEILGNDPDEEGQPKAPVLPVEKPVQRSGKRNAPAEAPAPPAAVTNTSGRGGRGGRGGRRGNLTGSEQAFNDRDAGRSNNRDKPLDEAARRERHSNSAEGGRPRGARSDGRGGRGGPGGRPPRGGRDDRHSRTGIAEHPKQAEKGWGENTGTGEWNDEKAGQQIALDEEKQGFDSTVDKPVNADGETPAVNEETAAAEVEPEIEDKTKSYAAYLAEQAEKKLALGDAALAVRKANEGSKLKIPEGREIARADETPYFVGGGGKQGRQREKKDKNFLALDHDMIARENAAARGTSGSRGGRGSRARGGRGGSDRERGSGRGDYRGRGGRGRSSTEAPTITDASAFPSLGA